MVCTYIAVMLYYGSNSNYKAFIVPRKGWLDGLIKSLARVPQILADVVLFAGSMIPK